MPVHNFFVTHVFRPLVVERRYGKMQASIVIFFVSAVFHELIVSAILRRVGFVAFVAIMLQVVFIKTSESMKGHQMGNVYFWATIILAIPLFVLHSFVVAVEADPGQITWNRGKPAFEL